jgi:4-hydroxy-tetrahydrodipicolinate synthase
VVDVLAGLKESEPLLVGVVEPTAPRVVAAIDQLVSDDVDGIVVTGPFYAAAGENEILRHYELIARHSPVPVLAYNIPANLGYPLSAQVMTKLLVEGLIVGIKDSSLDLTTLRLVTAGVPDAASALILTGSDTLLDCALDVGANGAVTGLSNVAPALFARAVRAHHDGERAELAQILRQLSILVQIYTPTEMHRGPNSTAIGGIKTALKLQGVIEHDTVSEPMTAPTQARREHIQAVLDEAARLGFSSTPTAVG